MDANAESERHGDTTDWMLHDMGATLDTVLPVAATLAPRPRGGGDVRSRCVMARVTL